MTLTNTIIDPRFALDSYDYELPPELIAQYPTPQRDGARLLVVDRQKGTLEDRSIGDLPSYLSSGDQLVLNDTKVLAARLKGRRRGGGAAEIFLLTPATEPIDSWWALIRPARRMPVGATVTLSGGHTATIGRSDGKGRHLVHFNAPSATILAECGEIPLPPYINRAADERDAERYQTIYAEHTGAVAAPTAGLHFSSELLKQIRQKGVETVAVTLHVGIGTFQPLTAQDVRTNRLHTELYTVSDTSAKVLNNCTGRRLSVGTTTCRTLESATTHEGIIHPGTQETELFIYPGYQFKSTDALLTNFHLPRSSLLLLVAALAGFEMMQAAYRHAIEARYRFFSYGDAMLIW